MTLNKHSPMAAREPGCLFHYNISPGYFMLSGNGNTNGLELVPRVLCLHDGTPMYLAEISREKKAFRLWRCPKCDARRTNEEDLLGEGQEKLLQFALVRRAPANG